MDIFTRFHGIANPSNILILTLFSSLVSIPGTAGTDAAALTAQYAALPQFGSAATAAFTTTPLANPTMAQAVAAAAGKQIEGESDINVFYKS